MKRILLLSNQARVLRALGLACALVLGCAAQADTVFSVSGKFDLGTEPGGDVYQYLTGTLTIDTVAGLITYSDLHTTSETTAAGVWPALDFVGDASKFGQCGPCTLINDWEFYMQIGFPDLNIFFPVPNLVGYNGGPADFTRILEAPSGEPAGFLLNGSAVITRDVDRRAVPEPSTMCLVGSACLGLLQRLRRRRG